MIDPELSLIAYVHLAGLAHKRRQNLPRDRFLVLASISACRAGWLELASTLRRRVLESNPHHQLKKYADLPHALRNEDFQVLARTLQDDCPYETAEHLLAGFGISPAAMAEQTPAGELGARLEQTLAEQGLP